MLRFTFLLCILLIATTITAQKGELVPARLILESGKEIKGFIKYGDYVDREVKLKYYKTRGGKAKTYKPKHIKAYSAQVILKDEAGKPYKTWKHYDRMEADRAPRIFASKLVWMEREVSGDIKLWTFYVEDPSNVADPYDYWYYIGLPSGQIVQVTEKNFQHISRNTFASYTALNSRVGDKDFRYRNLDRMVRDFNFWKANRHDAAEYRVAMVEKRRD